MIRQPVMILLIVTTCLIPVSSAAQTTRVSVASDGTEASKNSTSFASSANGRFVAFQSDATNLTPEATAGRFLHDRDSSQTVYLGGSVSRRMSVSDDGRFVLAVDRVLDRQSGITQVILPELAPGSTFVNGNIIDHAVLSRSGRYVAFVSDRRRYAGDCCSAPGYRAVFVRNLDTGTLCSFSVPPTDFSGGIEPLVVLNTQLSVSADGRYVFFTSAAALEPYTGAQESFRSVYTYDCETSRLIRVSVSPEGHPVADVGFYATTDGRFVAFWDSRTLWIWDRATSRSRVAWSAEPFALPGFGAVLSDDARYVGLFLRMQPPVGDPVGHTYQLDLSTGVLFQIDLDPGGGPPNDGVDGFAMSADGRWIAFASRASDLVPGDTNHCPGLGGVPGSCLDVFVADAFDSDGDGVSTAYERSFGLNPYDSGDAGGDPDSDGRTNLEEFQAQSHPRNVATYTRYLAEGSTGFFETRMSVANPGTTDALVSLRFLKGDGDITSYPFVVPGQQDRKVIVSGLPGLSDTAFSTVMESDQPVVIDRQMWWDTAIAYGTSTETGVVAPGLTWYFAEGATQGGFDLFYLIQNPNDADAQVTARYLLPSGVPLEKSYVVPAHSRFNIWADLETFPAGSSDLALASTDVSAVFEVTNGVPVIAERAMYLSTPGVLFEGGHESAGVSTPATQWFFAEGATGAFFDTYILLANPSATSDAIVRATYLLPDGGTLTKLYTVAANARSNIWVDAEQFPDGQGGVTAALADTAVSTKLEVLNGIGIVAERSMWWPGPTAATWSEAHNAFGSTATATRWVFAEGIVLGPPTNTETYFLVANTGNTVARVRVTLLFDTGAPAVSREYDVLPQSRFNVPVRTEFPEAFNLGFGAVIESVGATPAPLVCERAMYNDAGGIVWRAGSDALGTTIP